MQLISERNCGSKRSPLEIVVCGAAAGFAASLLLSGLSRVLPGLDMDPKLGEQKSGSKPPAPDDPFNARHVREWQARSQSPAAYPSEKQSEEHEAHGGPPAFTPTGALARPQAPGP